MRRRLSALLLVLCLCLTLLPAASAAGDLLQDSYTTSTGLTIHVDREPFGFNTDQYASLDYVGEGLLKASVRNGDGEYTYCLIDFSGKQVAQLTDDLYRQLNYFHDGRARVEVYDPWTGETGYGFLDTTGKMAIPATLDSSVTQFSDGRARIMGDNGRYGYIDVNGNQVIPCQYTNATEFTNGYAVVEGLKGTSLESDQFLSIIDPSGKVVWTSPTHQERVGMEGYRAVPDYQLSYYMPEHSGVAEGKVLLLYAPGGSQGTSYALVGVDGSVTPLPDVPNYGSDHFPAYVGNGLIYQLKGVYWGLMKQDGTVVYPYVSYVSGEQCNFQSGLSLCYVDNCYGLIDLNGQYVIEPNQDLVIQSPFYDGTALVTTRNPPYEYYYLTVDGAATPDPEPTPDQPSSWAAEQVNQAISAGLVPESLQSQYTQTATRAEFCALAVELYETVKGTEITERATFSDTSDVNVEKMAGLGVVGGVGDGKFNPGGELNREQAATILARLAEALGQPLAASEPTFADNGSISSWAKEAEGQMQASGVMSGTGNNSFSPLQPYTREQCMMTALRLFQQMK